MITLFALIAGISVGYIVGNVFPLKKPDKEVVYKTPYFEPIRVAAHDVPHPHQHPNGMPK